MYCSLFQSRYCLLLLQLVLHQGLKLSLPWAEACGELMSYKQTIDSLFAIKDSLIALSTKHVQLYKRIYALFWKLITSGDCWRGRLHQKRVENSSGGVILIFFHQVWTFFLNIGIFIQLYPFYCFMALSSDIFFAELAEDLIPCGFSTKISFQYFSSLLGNPLKYISTKGNFQILGLQYPILVKTFVGTFFFL